MSAVLIAFENRETDKIQKKLNKFVEVFYKDIDASQSNKKV
jgi:hypothetical protein